MDETIAIPDSVDRIDAAWLNRALASDATIGEVDHVDVHHFADGVGILGELARLELSYRPGESGPATLVAKCPSASPENQFLGIAMGFYLREVNFYRHVASRVDIPVPTAHHAAADPSGVPFVLLLEDVVGAHTPDQLGGGSPPTTPTGSSGQSRRCTHSSGGDTTNSTDSTGCPR